MTDFKIYVFGPASGSIAFELPSCEKCNDDKLFLASSEFELKRESSIFKIERFHRSGLSILRASIYKQVFERGMDRMGHSFGVSIEFIGAIALPNTIQNTLIEILNFVENDCVANKEFCEFESFKNFVESNFLAVFPGIKSQLYQEVSDLKLKKHLNYFNPNSFCCEVASIEDASVALHINWFINSPVSLFISSIIIYPENSGVSGINFPKFHAANFYDEIIPLMYDKLISYESEISSLKIKEINDTRRIDNLERCIEDNKKELLNRSGQNSTFINYPETVPSYEPLRVSKEPIGFTNKTYMVDRASSSKKSTSRSRDIEELVVNKPFLSSKVLWAFLAVLFLTVFIVIALTFFNVL